MFSPNQAVCCPKSAFAVRIARRLTALIAGGQLKMHGIRSRPDRLESEFAFWVFSSISDVRTAAAISGDCDISCGALDREPPAP